MLCLWMIFGEIEIVDQLIHTAMQTDVGSEVLEQTETPVMVGISLVFLPDRRSTPHRATFAEEVEEDHVARFDGTEHLLARILVPTLANPLCFRIGFLHCSIDGLEARIEVETCRDIRCLMERIHRVVVGFAKETDALFVEHVRELLETRIGRHKDARTGEAVP